MGVEPISNCFAGSRLAVWLQRQSVVGLQKKAQVATPGLVAIRAESSGHGCRAARAWLIAYRGEVSGITKLRAHQRFILRVGRHFPWQYEEGGSFPEKVQRATIRLDVALQAIAHESLTTHERNEPHSRPAQQFAE
jgi:hypothetical protein